MLGVKWQRMESAGLRSAYGLDPPRKGVLVRSIWPTSPVSKEVRPDDIIMRFDGVDIACDGTVPFRYTSPQLKCRMVQCLVRWLRECMYDSLALALQQFSLWLLYSTTCLLWQAQSRNMY